MIELLEEWRDRVPKRQVWIAMFLTLQSAAIGFLTLKLLSHIGAPPREAAKLAGLFQMMAVLPPFVVFVIPVLAMGLERAFPHLEVADAE